MKSTKIDPNIQRRLATILDSYPLVTNIVNAINLNGGTAFLVGGAVRDLFLELELKDLDIEVHGLSLEKLEAVLKKIGIVSLVGSAFGVLRLHGLNVDWSLPRTDMAGRKPDVTIDPFMHVEQAFARRDLTINAMGINLITFELIDPFDGLQDLRNKILRVPDEDLFKQDPLRLFRVMQFIGRFEMIPDKQLNMICKSMDISGVSVERVESEFEKLFLKSTQPSLGIRWLRHISRLSEILPELAATIGVIQTPRFHPEGDVFEHSMQVLDAMVVLPYENKCEKLIMMYAALCHDLGKVIVTKEIDGEIKSIGHETESGWLARDMLKRITRNNDLIDAVCVLVRNHMLPAQFVDNHAKSSAYKRLAKKIAPYATLHMLADLALADKRGRNPKEKKPLKTNFDDIDLFLKRAQQAQVSKKPEPPVLLGRDLLDVVEPGRKMGELLEWAYEMQIQEEVKDKEILKERVLKAFNIQ